MFFIMVCSFLIALACPVSAQTTAQGPNNSLSEPISARSRAVQHLNDLLKTKSLDKYVDDTYNQDKYITKEFLKITSAMTKICKIDTSNPYVQIRHLHENSTLLCVGDIHGNLASLKSTINTWKDAGYFNDAFEIKKNIVIVFLGDYIDNGPCSDAVMTSLFALKILNKDNVFILRGNHESGNINSLLYMFDDLVKADRVSQALLPCLYFVTSDGSIITASHANPPLWDNLNLNKNFVSIDTQDYTKLPFAKIAELANNKLSKMPWNTVDGTFLNRFGLPINFGVTVCMSEISKLLKPLINKGLKVAFCGHSHPKDGYALYSLEKMTKSNITNLNNWTEDNWLVDNINNTNDFFICILNMSGYWGRSATECIKTSIGYCYSKLTIGKSRTDWTLEFVTK